MNTALAISAGFIGFCCLLAAIARIIVSRTIQSCLVKELLYEAIAAAELCACCFELIIGECDRQHKRNQQHIKVKLIFWFFFYVLGARLSYAPHQMYCAYNSVPLT